VAADLQLLFSNSPWLLPAVGGLLGLVVGSFLNVVIHRLPKMMERDWREQYASLGTDQNGSVATSSPSLPADERYNLLTPRSACPACATPIKPWHNLPVLGWLLLKGRCAACAAPIALRYPVVEGVTGLLSAFVVWHFGWSPEAAAGLLITWTLIALAVIDFDHHLLPDVLTLPLLWAGLLFHLLWPSPGSSSPFSTLEAGVIGAVAGYLSLWLVYHAFRLVTGKEGMGYGDFKLFAALGAWLGWQALPLIILLSAATGAVTGVALIALGRHGRDKPMPFGPWLAAAGWIALIWGEPLMAAWLGPR
jgi:leader peptidase (prepilin peptidase)/N-methyltransferase